MEAESKSLSFLRSSLVAKSPVFDNSDFLSWFLGRADANAFSVRPIAFAAMDKWRFEEGTRNLAHASGRFFRIEGILVETNFAKEGRWDQPIINQPEIGILGILSKRFGGVRHFLMQAKAEPGNVNNLQLSPTVQATPSNYTRVHSGRVPSYLEYFSDAPPARRLVDQLQTEQGSRFLRKRNRNMIVDIEDEVPVLDDFRWLTLGEIKALLERENFVNMDARSVLSCIPFLEFHAGAGPAVGLPEEARGVEGFGRRLLESIHAGEGALDSIDTLLSWLTEMKTTYSLRVDSIPLCDVRDWKITDREIVHRSHEHFSIIAVEVEAANREVARWTQPLLKDAGRGLHGFLCQQQAGVLHFLVQATVEPGNLDVVDLAPTVSCSNVEARRGRPDAPHFLHYFLEPRPETLRYSVVQSEEGGRFFELENHNMIVELEPRIQIDLPGHFRWMSLAQLLEFLKHGYLSVDARTLLACLRWA